VNDTEQNHLRDVAKRAVVRLQTAGFTAYWAGGCVRDYLMGLTPKDYDIATNATPAQVSALFPGSCEVGKAFGVVRAPIEDAEIEVATFRKDESYKDGRRPESVSFTDPKTDAERRDFTINAMFYDPVTDKYLDFVGGQNDISARLVRCVGKPADRFAEDHLRMLRAVRFASVLDFSLEPETAAAIKVCANLVTRISGERVGDELSRILTESKRAGDAIMMMDELRLLQVLLPEAHAMKGVEQPPAFHPEGDVFRHTVAALNLMKSPSIQLAWSVLLHDVGKPMTAVQHPERIRFNGHDEQGAEIAGRILERLRFSSDDTQAICYSIRNHMHFLEVRNMRRSKLRRLIGAPTFAIELELHRLDCLASHGDLANWQFLVDVQKQMADEPVLPPPWVTGNDIMHLGVPHGPEIGAWKQKAYDAQLEGRFQNRDETLKWLESEMMRENRER